MAKQKSKFNSRYIAIHNLLNLDSESDGNYESMGNRIARSLGYKNHRTLSHKHDFRINSNKSCTRPSTGSSCINDIADFGSASGNSI